uniref:Uncharacterized protein n=1 Tax=Lepeophtheirus salmonis TaxID=72036 RepID=A0A0K2TFS3_LEPSM
MTSIASLGNLSFLDENNFIVDPVFNRSSDRVVAFNDNGDMFEELWTITAVTHPPSVMMLVQLHQMG